MPEYEGKIDCIYIDPPYNTGKEGWIYNDAVNDPKIKRWLGQVVGKEGEDLSRHDKWLCMMYPRLKLLHRLLANDGVLFVSIGEDEIHTLRFLLDEIFGRDKRLTTFTWRTDGNFDNQAKIKLCHEYILMYCKKPDLFPYPPVIDISIKDSSKLFKPIIRNTIVKNGPKNPVSKVILPSYFPADFNSGKIDSRTNSWPHYFSECLVVDGKIQSPVEVASGWSSLDLLKEFISNNFEPVFDTKGQETTFVVTQTGAIESIKKRDKPSHVISALTGLGSTQSMSQELEIAGITFDYPKPVDLICYLISMIDKKDCLVLDSFAGSGTTGHAVLKLNSQDGGSRHFICIEMMDYIENITAERIRKIITGYGEEKNRIAGLGGSFEFYTVGNRIFQEDDRLNESVGINAIRNYIAYSEGIPEEYQTSQENPFSSYLLGLSRETAWLFYYDPEHVTVLDLDFLASLRFGEIKPDNAIIYADRCLLDKSFMTRHGVIFKKIPRDISRF